MGGNHGKVAIVSVNHSFGDSHSIYTFQNIDGFTPHHLGSITMHRVGRDGLDILDVSKHAINPGDRCFFSFGEIDVRCHIHREATDRQRDLAEIIDALAVGYLETVASQAMPDIPFWVVSVLPPPRWERMPKHIQEDTLYPFRGSNSERAGHAVALNEAVRREADARNVHYLDLHRLYSDEDNMLVPELSDGQYHIGDNYFVRRELTELGVIPC